MLRHKKLAAGGLLLAALTVGGLTASAARDGFGPRGMHGPGRHGGGMMGLMGPVCRGNASEAADMALVKLQYKINPTDAQKGAFEDLKTAVRSAALKAKAGCPTPPAKSADGTPPPAKPAPERLATLETSLAAQLDAVRTIRPAADKLYATLSDEQKKAVDSPPHHGPRGWWGKQGGPGGEHGG